MERDSPLSLDSAVGGETKMARKGQRYDADGRGSEVVAVARSESGLDLGALVRSVLVLRGIDPDCMVWPKDRSIEEPVFLSDAGKPMKSSGGGVKSSMLPRVRAILLRMQVAGDQDLVDVKVGEISRYCWKISGTTAMLAQKKDKAMITGQGRWGLYVKRPSAMIEYYRQATLDEKLNTTDLTLTKQPTKPKKL